MTHFKALYGRDPPTILDYLVRSTRDESLHVSLYQYQQVIMQLNDHMRKSKIHMEKQANTQRRDFTFNVGDFVLLKLQPHRKPLSPIACHKSYRSDSLPFYESSNVSDL